MAIEVYLDEFDGSLSPSVLFDQDRMKLNQSVQLIDYLLYVELCKLRTEWHMQLAAHMPSSTGKKRIMPERRTSLTTTVREQAL